ncbi:MAG: hypothetical protein AAF940_04070 [Pseudomonadota bacterium]
MNNASRFLRIALFALGGLIALPLLLVLAILSFLFIISSMAVLAVRGLFGRGPRWDDTMFTHQYEAEAVRADGRKMGKRPIIIDHE